MLTKEQIEFLNRVCTDKWTECNDVILVDGNVDISHMNLTQIPVQFGEIKGSFKCSYNKLTTLKGTPSIIEGYFTCHSNQLTSLEGGPKKVGSSYSCDSNQLTNLIGAPEIHNGSFYCESNQLTSLEGCPRIIKYDLWCENNPNLHILYGIGYVGRHIKFSYFIDEYKKINKWIISNTYTFCVVITSFDISKQIKDEQLYLCLLHSPKEIRQHFSKYILQLIDTRVC